MSRRKNAHNGVCIDILLFFYHFIFADPFLLRLSLLHRAHAIYAHESRESVHIPSKIGWPFEEKAPEPQPKMSWIGGAKQVVADERNAVVSVVDFFFFALTKNT